MPAPCMCQGSNHSGRFQKRKGYEQHFLKSDGSSFTLHRQGYSGVVTYCKLGLTVDAQDGFGAHVQFDEEGKIIFFCMQSDVISWKYF